MLAEAATANLVQIAELSIASGVLAILWAPEAGRAFECLDPVGLPMERCRWGAPGSPSNSRRVSTTASTTPSRMLPGRRADATLFVGLARTLQVDFVSIGDWPG